MPEAFKHHFLVFVPQEFDVDSTMCVFVPECLPPSEWVSRLPRYLERGAEEKPDDCPDRAG